MTSFYFNGVPRYMKPGETVRIGFRVYNDYRNDTTVKVTVYQKEPSLKQIGQTSFTARAKSFVNFTSLLEFTMPNTNKAVLYAEAVFMYSDGTKMITFARTTVYRKEEPPTEPPKVPKPPTKPPKKPPEPYIPYDRIQAAVISAIKRRPIWHEVKENVFLIEVTDTVKQARNGVQSAWLVIDVNTQKMKVKKGVPSNFCTTPKCILQRWLNGQEVQRTTVDGIRYLVTMPCSILILYHNGRKEHAGNVMSQNNMLTWLTWYRYIGQIVEDTVDENIPESFESEESQSDTDTGETEKKDNTFLMLAAGGVALLLIGIQKMEKMYMWILILVGAYLIYKFVIKSGSTSTNSSTTSGSESIYRPRHRKDGCIEIINPLTKRKEIICPL